MATSIRCTLPTCSCECFAPGKSQLRTCEQCRHGWVAHALDKLSTGHAFPSLLAEVVHSDIAFDVASLMLYGAQAAPVRLRILLDRLFSVLKSQEVDRILLGLGWSQEDYARGYILQDQDGKVLQHWNVATREEELVILNQFLRFGETKSIAEVMLQDLQSVDSQSVQKKNESDIRAFIERISGRHNLNSTCDTPDIEILPPTPPSLRTLAKRQDNEGRISGKTQTVAEGEGSCQDGGMPAHNIHLANLEQTVLKAGVIQPPPRLRGRMATLNSNPHTPKRSSATAINSTHDVPSTSGSSAPTVLNSSVSMFPASAKRFSSFSFKSHRKTTLSKRRSWTPYSSVANSKQVKCNTCNKWFYDKGTWKIHFGAVHLKVKYRCTVEGCNMAFSSLRSRNRHSANPSPRIHRFVSNSRRGSKQRVGLWRDAQLQLENREKDDHREDINDDDVTMVTDDVTSISENKASVAYGDKYLDGKDGEEKQGNCVANSTVISPNNSTSEMTSASETIKQPNSPENNAELANIKEETEDFMETSEPVESQPIAKDVRPSDNSEQSQLTRDSPSFAVHHFKKRKSNAPRKFFIPKQEEDEDCQVEGVIFKTEDTEVQEDDVQDAEEDETGIDLEEITEYEATSHEDSDRPSNEYHYVPPGAFGQKERPSAERVSMNRSQNIENLHLEQDRIRSQVAEQLGIGIDTCFYMNADGLPSCYLCGKTFQSKQTVKVHYQNVHLKLMHACTIEGCNAMFPSRRSRDRHSTNFNLHRKLFEKGVPLKDGFDQTQPPNLTYCPPLGQATDLTQGSSHSLSDSSSTNSSEGVKSRLKQPRLDSSLGTDAIDNGHRQPSPNEIDLQLTRQELPPSSRHRYAMQDNTATSSSYHASTQQQRYIMQVDQNGLSPLAYSQTFNSTPIPPAKDLYPLKFVGNLICNICKKAYSTKDTLRTHYKNIHLREMHKCTVQGCNLMFSSVRSRNRHSQNPNLHRHCLNSDDNPGGTDPVDV